MAIEQDYSKQPTTLAMEVEMEAVHLAKTGQGDRCLLSVVSGDQKFVLAFTMDDIKDLRDAFDMMASQAPESFR